jgi:hypothetical protein
MRRISLRFFTLAVAASLLSGCNAMSTTSSTSYATQDFTGNWQLGISDPPYPGPYPIAALTGAMAGQGQNITGVFRIGGTGCVSPTQDVTFVGSQTADGNLTLNSTNLPNNVATITATSSGIMPLTNGITPFLGGLVVTGSGQCTMGGIALRGEEIAPLTGTFTGSLTSTSGVTSSFTVALKQSVGNSDGQFPESGTITVASSSCANVFSLTGTVSGLTLTATLTPTSGPPATATLATEPPYGNSTAPLSLSINITGTGCNAGSFTGNLAKQ